MDNNVEKVDLDSVDWKSSREFFESLGEALDKLDDKDESYNFTWVGKRKSIIEAGTPINKTLRPDMEASKDFENTKNMLIVGDNLDALKLLQESYLGKIKVIYIDPPYNTGHDFVYHDNFTIQKADYDNNIRDEDSKIIVSEDEFAENARSNGRFHSDWLSMMYPRLKLARNLLSDDGVIFISIDDNEQTNLKKICDEIFGEDNFLAQLIVVSAPAGTQSAVDFSQQHQYVLCYKRSDAYHTASIPLSSEQLKAKYNYGEDEKGPFYIERLWKRGLGGRMEDVPSLHFPVYFNSKTNEIVVDNEYDSYQQKDSLIKIIPYQTKGVLGRWTWSREKMRSERDDLIVVKVAGEYKLHKKVHLADDNGSKPYTIIDSKIGRTELGSLEIKEILDGKYFDYPKYSGFVKYFEKLHADKDAIVLDFFAGSGTTGHATMELNSEDGGHRKFICVQLDEKTDPKSDAKKAGYDTIDSITAERLRRVGNKIDDKYPEKNVDTGFRVLRIDSGNENIDNRKKISDISQSNLFGAIDNIKKDRTPLDLLFGVVYASALPFDLKLETRKIGDNTVYLYGYLDEGTGLAACFDDNIPEETIKEIANLKALTAAFKDSSFADSAAKINLSEHFRIISPDTKVKVL